MSIYADSLSSPNSALAAWTVIVHNNVSSFQYELKQSRIHHELIFS